MLLFEKKIAKKGRAASASPRAALALDCYASARTLGYVVAGARKKGEVRRTAKLSGKKNTHGDLVVLQRKKVRTSE
jgi:hypothetical protein